jgi:hypothetical protein
MTTKMNNINIKIDSPDVDLRTLKGKLDKVRLDLISMDATLQSRVKMSPSKVQEYSHALKNGVELPPLLVFKINKGSYLLVDGWHRLQAHINLNEKGSTRIAVEVLESFNKVSPHILRFIGGIRNSTQGLPLNPSDKRTLFKDYVKGKVNKDGHRYKSYREIASELGCIPYQTLHKWMQIDFPRVAGVMGRGEMVEQPSAKGSGNRIANMPDLRFREIELYVATILEEAKQAENNHLLETYKLIGKMLAEELNKIEQITEPPRDPNDDF